MLLSCRRRKTECTVSHYPYRWGTARQGEPVPARHQIPSKTCRRSRGGRPIPGVGNSDSSRLPLFVRQIPASRYKIVLRCRLVPGGAPVPGGVSRSCRAGPRWP
ncbi:hypothetical protein GCM10010319_22300 [Streptomyces blastmyceticus]|uniref:Uncharacterized protein n=1 Tax=Streptomyces blastmyceticus TaxID=68180 RepID=A0ABN0WSB1_9ACTN